MENISPEPVDAWKPNRAAGPGSRKPTNIATSKLVSSAFLFPKSSFSALSMFSVLSELDDLGSNIYWWLLLFACVNRQNDR